MIKVYDRKTKGYEIEKVVGEKALRWVYETPVGQGVLEAVVKRKLFSSLYGKLMDTRQSRKMIQEFVTANGIDMEESLLPSESFDSFNDFFVRKLKPEKRPFSRYGGDFISPVDGRLLAYTDIDTEKLVQIKGFTYSLKELVGDLGLLERFRGGIMMVFRLCPLDYHRFHFCDSGICSRPREIRGSYYSVNPLSLSRIPRVYVENKRVFSLMRSDHFGDILHVEVGATNVGTIVQTYTPSRRFERGSEKGYFRFGGSTVILFMEKDSFSLHGDILRESAMGLETHVRFGETIGEKKS